MRHAFTVALARSGSWSWRPSPASTSRRPDAPAVTSPSPLPVRPPASRSSSSTYCACVPGCTTTAPGRTPTTAAVSRHFEHLKQATAGGRVILAGRTMEPGDKTFGLVIFEAADEGEAQALHGVGPCGRRGRHVRDAASVRGRAAAEGLIQAPAARHRLPWSPRRTRRPSPPFSSCRRAGALARRRAPATYVRSSSSSASPVYTARRCRCGTLSAQPVNPKCSRPRNSAR